MAQQPGGPAPAYSLAPRPRGASAGAKAGSLALSVLGGVLLIVFFAVSYRQIVTQLRGTDLPHLVPYFLLTALVTVALGAAAVACGRLSGLGPILGSAFVGLVALVVLFSLYIGETRWLWPDQRRLRDAVNVGLAAAGDGTLILLGTIVLGAGIASAVAGRRPTPLSARTLPLAAVSFVLLIGAVIAAYFASGGLARLLMTGIPRTANELFDAIPWGSWALMACVLVAVLVAFIMAGSDPRGLVVAGLLLSIGAELLVVRPQTAFTLLPRQFAYGGLGGHAVLALCAWLVFTFGIGVWWRRASKR